ncbi:MAG: MATE family efflux transporter [Paludibacteraceae bacterium]|nr:MATE family efflux transporter [Paludibacteraceae bacterium]
MNNINKDILKLAVPSILANITIPLVGIVDTAIVGHLSDAAAIGGIAIGTMLFDLLYWNFGFLRVGTSGLTAQAFGRTVSGERLPVNGECRKILTQSVTIALIAALFVWAIQWLFVTAVLAIVPCSAEVANVARQYFFVRIWAAPATLMLMAFKGWFIGMQDTKSAMIVDILVNVVNMGASYALAVHTPLGVVGVAWGTFIAQYTGLLTGILILTFKYGIVHIGLQETKEAMRWSELRQMMAFNGNLFVRSLCFMVVYVGYTSLASRFGDTELAVSSILMKLFMFFSFFIDGFAYAGAALVGKAIGEWTMDNGKWKIREIVRLLFNWSIGVGIVFTVVYWLRGSECIGLMTSDGTVLEASARYMGWLIAMPLVSALAFMWDGVYVGATAGKEIRNAMIWAAIGFVAFYAATYRFVGAQALYIAYFAHLAARVIYLSCRYEKNIGNTVSPDGSDEL